jgi:hypothetical protein
MNKQLLLLLFITPLILVGNIQGENGSENKEIALIVAPQHPPTDIMERATASPGSTYFWIKGYWQWVNNNWQWVPGHWEQQPRPGSVWRNGRWSQTFQGWVWIPGYWR